jgi:hypothetical protein
MSRSFGTMMIVSAMVRNCVIPCSATFARRRPSKPKGRVTIATVRTPSSRATWATTGAAPVPVPPPMPATMKTMSAPVRASRSRAWLSSAASCPTRGLPPAPRPRVHFSPRQMRVAALAPFRACMSVLTAISSAPLMPPAISRSITLPPAPPTPTTRMAIGRTLLSCSMVMASLLLRLSPEPAGRSGATGSKSGDSSGRG